MEEDAAVEVALAVFAALIEVLIERKAISVSDVLELVEITERYNGRE